MVDILNILREDLDVLIALLDYKDAAIDALKATYIKGKKEGSSSIGKLNSKNVALQERLKKMEVRLKALTEKNEDLT